MAQFDANIKLILDANQALKDAKKVAKGIEKEFNKLAQKIQKDGPLDKYIEANDALAAQAKQLDQITLTNKKQAAVAKEKVKYELRLEAATQRRLALEKALTRTQGVTRQSQASQERVARAQRAAAADPKDLALQQAANTLLERELQIRREINRVAEEGNKAKSKSFSRGTRLGQLERSGAVDESKIQKLINLNKEYVRAAEQGQTALAKSIDRRVDKELAGIEKVINAQKRAGGPRSPIQGTETMEGSPKFLAAQLKAIDKQENSVNKTLDDQRKLRERNAKAAERTAKATKRTADAEQKAAATLRKKALKGALEGVGFPLLFGAGPGAILGGLAGGTAGGALDLGFGAQALGTAIGGAFDSFARSAAELGQALNPLTADLDKITKASGAANSEFSQLIKELESLGREEEALRLATQKLAVVVGQDGVSSLRDFGEQSKALGDEVTIVFTRMQAAIAALITQSGILAALTRTIETETLTSQAMDSINRGGADRQRILDAASPQMRESLESGGNIRFAEITQDMRDAQKELNVEKALAIELSAQEALAQAESLEALEGAVAQKQIEKQLTELNAAANDATRVLLQEQLALQQKINEKQELYDKFNQGQIKARELSIRLAAIELDYETRLLDIKNKAAAADKAAADKAAREAERLAKEAERNQKRREDANDSIDLRRKRSNFKLYDLQVETTRLLQGESAAREKQIELIEQRLQTSLDILDIEEKQSLRQNEGLGIESKIIELKNQERLFARVEAENDIKKLQREEKLLLLRQKSLKIIEDMNRKQTLSEGAASIQSAQLRLDNPFGGDNYERQLQQIQQIQELNATKFASEQKIANLTEERRKAALLGDVREAERINELIQEQEKFNNQLIEQIEIRQDVETAALNQQLALEKLSGVQSALAGGLSNIMSSAVQDVVTGTSTVQEAFGNMFKAIGQAFLDMVAQILAQRAVLMLLKAFQPTPSPSSGALNIGLAAGNPVQLASGGYVTRPTPALIGEAGEPEYVIPASKMSGAAQAYNAGARGDDVLSGSHLFSTYNAGNNGGTIFVESTVINNVEYVTMDQARAMTKEAAASGAQRGHGRTMNVLQHSRGQRSRIGMS